MKESTEKKLIAVIKLLRDWSYKDCIKHENSITTYGDTDRISSDVNYGRVEAFNEVIELIEKRKER